MVQEETAQRFRIYYTRYNIYICCQHCRRYRYSICVYACVYICTVYKYEDQGSSNATRHINGDFMFYEQECEIDLRERGDTSTLGDVDILRRQR